GGYVIVVEGGVFAGSEFYDYTILLPELFIDATIHPDGTAYSPDDGNSDDGYSIDWNLLNNTAGAFGMANTAKTGLIDTAVLSNAEMSAKEFSKLSKAAKAAKTTEALGKFGSGYLKVFKGMG